jgi:hypothetical protein
MDEQGIGDNDKSDVKKLEKFLEELERFGFGEITVQ